MPPKPRQTAGPSPTPPWRKTGNGNGPSMSGPEAKLRRKAKELGQCRSCSEPSIPGQTRRPTFAEKRREYRGAGTPSEENRPLRTKIRTCLVTTASLGNQSSRHRWRPSSWVQGLHSLTAVVLQDVDLRNSTPLSPMSYIRHTFPLVNTAMPSPGTMCGPMVAYCSN